MPDNSLSILDHPQALCNMVRRISVAAGDVILSHFDESGYKTAGIKDDGSPVTEADREAEILICKALEDITPGIPVVAEEKTAAGDVPDISGADWFWLTDPLDGTREFVAGSPDFTVNVGLIHLGVPVLGVIYAPALGELYSGCGESTGVRWTAESGIEKSISCRYPPSEGLTVVASKSRSSVRLDEYLQEMKVKKILKKGSSLKLCLIASGKADLHPRFGPTSEWDTAAGDALIRSCGGELVDFNGAPLLYGKVAAGFANPSFIASGKVYREIPG